MIFRGFAACFDARVVYELHRLNHVITLFYTNFGAPEDDACSLFDVSATVVDTRIHWKQQNGDSLRWLGEECRYTCVTHVVNPLGPSFPISVRPRLFSSSCCETGNHWSKHLGRNNRVNVVRNCRLIEQYKMKLIAELINARMSMRSPATKENIFLIVPFRSVIDRG